ncbi:MAG: hypothetical protein FWE74_06055 [Oscillospiraceae bacterium]|nr:hypothetical protein [Oscillospiraceae bacterium]
MAYETKVILTLLADKAAMAESAEEVYDAIRKAANVEGLQLPTYKEYKEEIKKDQ